MSDPASINIRRRIEWGDTDAAGHYHFTAALRLAEAAEGALLQQAGLRDASYGLPRVRVETDFSRPLHYGEIATVHLWVSDVGRSSIRFGFTISHGDELAADGTVVAVRIDPATRVPAPWPEELRALLLSAGAQQDPLLA